MFTTNPYIPLTDWMSPAIPQTHIILMVLALVFGTVFDLVHGQKIRFFLQGRQQAKARVTTRVKRWPGYYYRSDFPTLDDASWHTFTSSRYNARTGEWALTKLPVHHLIA